MVPAHRDLTQTQPGLVGEKKKFDIKREPNGMRFFQNWPADIQSKRFETALRVPKRHSGRKSHDQIENASGLLTSPRLVNADQFSVERARTKHKIDISSCDRFDHFRNLAQRRRKIGVEEQSDGFGCGEQSSSHCRAFAAIRKV